MIEWGKGYPLATAPKIDGQEILIWFPRGGFFHPCSYRQIDDCWANEFFALSDEDENSVVWWPLPSPPQA